MVEAEIITERELQYVWLCETCSARAQLVQIQRDPASRMNLFIVRCASGLWTTIQITDSFRAEMGPIQHFQHNAFTSPPAPRPDNAQLRLRCLSGCGDVVNLNVSTDYSRDGRIITSMCEGPRLNIFIAEQTWRNGVKRISYRHDGNYVVFDNDMRVASEGRVEPVIQYNPSLMVTGTQTISGTNTNIFDHQALNEYQRHAVEVAQQEADRQREEIWREYRERTVSPEDAAARRIRSANDRAMQELYRDALIYGTSIAELMTPPKQQPVKPQPRPARLVRRRALEKPEKKEGK